MDDNFLYFTKKFILSFFERKLIISVTLKHENIPINDVFVCDHDVYNILGYA